MRSLLWGTIAQLSSAAAARVLWTPCTFTFAKVRARYAKFELLSHYGPYYGGLQYMHVFYGGMALFQFSVIGD